MNTKKKVVVLTAAIITVVALALGIGYAAWDSSKDAKNFVVKTGSNAAITVSLTENKDGKSLVPSGQIGLGVTGTDKTAVKTLGSIDIALNKEAEINDLALVYNVTAIYSVPSDNKKSIADIKKMTAEELKTANIVDLSVKHDVVDSDNKVTAQNDRFITGDTKWEGQDDADKPKLAPEGTDLRINFNYDGKNYAAGEQIAFDVTDTDNPVINGVNVSIEFTRNATEEFVTMNDFLGRQIMLEITVSVEAKTVAPSTSA